ncbi:MAG: thiamine pyrophosphate-dependent enzyme [Chloroflexota bacterium]
MSEFRRYELLQEIVPVLNDQTLVVCNIGFPSQELYAIKDDPRHFYMLGSMGLSSSIGLGLSRTTGKKVVSIDGDGSVLMNLGTLSTIANFAPENYILFIVDNEAYGSTGDQQTHTAGKTDLAAMARAAGIENVLEVDGQSAKACLESCLQEAGPHVIVAKVASGSPKLKAIPMSPGLIRDRFKAEVQA